jgi:hypothetical protein
MNRILPGAMDKRTPRGRSARHLLTAGQRRRRRDPASRRPTISVWRYAIGVGVLHPRTGSLRPARIASTLVWTQGTR